MSWQPSMAPPDATSSLTAGCPVFWLAGADGARGAGEPPVTGLLPWRPAGRGLSSACALLTALAAISAIICRTACLSNVPAHGPPRWGSAEAPASLPIGEPVVPPAAAPIVLGVGSFCAAAACGGVPRQPELGATGMARWSLSATRDRNSDAMPGSPHAERPVAGQCQNSMPVSGSMCGPFHTLRARVASSRSCSCLALSAAATSAAEPGLRRQ
mmetsp:Transcript_101524/g.327627  ORF Transcript_101524/g.327627 Transcript_101524/m.327627 type:complete len:214 (-) Transcript_101524:505-1146(-)